MAVPDPRPDPAGGAGAAAPVAVEEGTAFLPRFDRDGLITCVTVDDRDGVVLMVAHMNGEALRLTMETGVAHYWSRSRKALWRKGDTSGQVQGVVELRTDCDQDALLMRVVPGGDGGACHTGRRSCFYRVLRRGAEGEPFALALDPSA